MTYGERMMEKGRTEGQRDFLLKQLALKFGELDAEARQRVQSADTVALERWLERILVAARIDAVFEA
jgi:uncharacterized protein DUF4351